MNSISLRYLFAVVALLLAPISAYCARPPKADSDTKTLRVFIFAGQSNMVGSDSRAKDIDRFPPFVGLDRPQDKVLFSYNIGREEKRTSGGWVALQPVDGIVGPELSFAGRVSQEIKAPIAIIKCAAGGTTLGADWNPDTPAGFKLYPLTLQLIQSSLAELDRRHVAYRIEGFMWHQGENDMFDRAFKPNYGKNLKNFIACWRRDLKTPRLKFYIGELCTKTIWGMDNRANMDAIRAGQKAVTETDPLTEYIPTSHDAVEIGGGTGLHYHYGTLGQLEHGVNYADAYLRTIGRRPGSSRPLKVWPYAKGSTVKLFILAGHRNMEGERAFTQELKTLPGQEDLAKDNTGIAFKYSLGGGYKTSKGWEPLGPAGYYDTFGPELSFAKTLRDKVSGNIAIGKFTHSGSQMNDWTPQGTETKDRNLYPQFIAFIREAIQELQARGNKVELAGIFYHVGENDMSFGPYRREAARWLQSTVAGSRRDLALPALKWYVSQQPPTEEKDLNAVDVTEDLSSIAASDPDFIHIRAFNLPPQPEKLVLTTLGIVPLGELLAQSYLEHRQLPERDKRDPFEDRSERRSRAMAPEALTWKAAASGSGDLLWRGAPLLEVSATGAAPVVNKTVSERALPFPAHWHDDALTLETQLPASGQGMGAIAQLTHHITAAQHVWIPHVSPYDDTVIGDHSFRSPAVILADDRHTLALIPDLDDVREAQLHGWRVWLDYDHPHRTLKVAAGAYRVGPFHVAYQSTPLTYAGQKVRIRLHVLVSEKKEDVRDPYGMVTKWLWKRWGHAGYLAGGSQRAPFANYAAHVVNWAFAPEPQGWGNTVWQQFRLNGREAGAPAFIVGVAQHPSVPLEKRRWREQRSVWNQAWFSTQRAANGLLRYARQIGSTDLEHRADLMTRVALSAPQTDGLFPAVYTAGGGGYSLYKDNPGWEQAHWTNSDRRPPGTSAQACHLLDAAFTARLLLEWHDLNPTEHEALDYVRRFVDRLCRLQRPNGAFPGWVEPNGAVPPILAEGPESAMSATLLLEWAGRFPKQAGVKEAARKALAYLENGPVRESRWEDFETYFSCSRWGEDRTGQIIERNGVYKSNTFSPFWCAEAFLAAAHLLRDSHYLALGRRCLDELSLYQQVWEPPVLPAPTHGGFGVMNSDGEWNDARQSLFAPLYLAYYRETGERDYFERGVSALRASFAMMYCPENTQVKAAYEHQHLFFGPESYGFMMENIAHGGPGPDPIGPFTIYTWGNGAALEAAAKVHDSYGDLYLDLDRKQVFGVDGCTARFEGGRLHVQDRYRRPTLTLTTSGGGRREIRMEDGQAVVSDFDAGAEK